MKVQANYRIDADARERAYAVLAKIGIRPTDAVNMLMSHIAMFGELPFKPAVPNLETAKTFEDTDKVVGLSRHDSVDDMFKELGL